METETEHVHRVYDAIAPHFNATRAGSRWPRVTTFIQRDAAGLVLDVGCGSGQYDADLSCDPSLPLLRICGRKGRHPLAANALYLPIRQACFDSTIAIAVIHHLASDERRRAAIDELIRVTRPGGRILITVWSLEHNGREIDEQDVLVPWKMPKRYRGKNFTDSSSKMTEFSRYYHLFKEGELEDLIDMEAVQIIDRGLEGQNWFVELEKLKSDEKHE